ncbi:MAG TPA: sugar transferase [Anaerolineae bacterium]|nr:sugar transferase [Anaerolineae bacterium]
MLRREEDANYIIFTYLSDIILTLVALFMAYQARLALPFGVQLTPELIHIDAGLYVTVVVIWTMVFFLLHVYDARHTLRWPDELRTLALAISLAAFVFAGVLYISYRDTPRLMFIYFILADFLFLIGYRWTMRLSLRWAGARQLSPRRILIVGAGSVGRAVAQKIHEQAWTGLQLTGFVDDDPEKQQRTIEGAPVLGGLNDTLSIVDDHKIDHVVFALPLRAHEALRDIVLRLYERPVRVFLVPDVLDLAFFRVTMEDWDGIPVMGLKEPVIDGVDRVIKRIFDLAVATISLLLLWPVMLVIAIAIKLDSPGPIILAQERVGENGQIFKVYKFRSMVQDADKMLDKVVVRTPDGKIIHKRKDDPRVTRVGRFIRRTSLDELPQLFNVLKGEMSMVGPRPELPFIVQNYETWQHKRFAVPPGITGWWQISGRSDKPMHLHTEDDLYYISHYSPLLDLQILIKTIGVVIRGKGAY